MTSVLINARAASRRRISGVERWAVELADRLPALHPDVYGVARPPAGLALGAGHAWEQGVLPWRARHADARLVLNPANLGPLAGPGNVLVVHDAAVLSHPEWYSRSYRLWHGRLLPRLVRQAKVVVTVSAFARSEIAAFTGRQEEEIHVVGGAVDARFRGADPHAAAAAFDLRRPYVLALGGGGPRKNMAALRLAVPALAARGVDVVVAGWQRSHQSAGHRLSGARSIGHVPEDLLPSLYAGARAFAMPSWHEGLGLPCLEAMAAGTPVVASERTALPQTCGDAALFVDPDDPGAVADALCAVIENGNLANRLREAGHRRADAATWDSVVAEIHRLTTAEASTL